MRRVHGGEARSDHPHILAEVCPRSNREPKKYGAPAEESGPDCERRHLGPVNHDPLACLEDHRNLHPGILRPDDVLAWGQDDPLRRLIIRTNMVQNPTNPCSIRLEDVVGHVGIISNAPIHVKTSRGEDNQLAPVDSIPGMTALHRLGHWNPDNGRTGVASHEDEKQQDTAPKNTTDGTVPWLWLDSAHEE